MFTFNKTQTAIRSLKYVTEFRRVSFENEREISTSVDKKLRLTDLRGKWRKLTGQPCDLILDIVNQSGKVVTLY